MQTIETILREEKEQLERIIKEAKKRLEKAPQGHLRVDGKRNKPEYYYINSESGKSNGRYIKRSELELARGLAQRDYDICVVKNAEAKAKAINAFLSKYEKTSLKRVYEKTNRYRRELICASVISDDEYIKKWQDVKYVGKVIAEDGPEFITEKGERVRSKSEKIIADKLFTLGIPYRYECPLILNGNIKMYPDFTILRMPSREEVYLEHFGMMDDNNYVDKVMLKLNTYKKTGYIRE